jgi:colanic acid biosynthesis glycosyl transferase WcaI
LVARLCGARLWTHVQDFEADAACATGLIDPMGVVARAARGLERTLFRMSDKVSTISPQMLARLAAMGLPPAGIYELRNWADDGFAPDPREAANYREQWQAGARSVVLYSGSIANKQGIEIIVDAARLLHERGDILFVICGNGPNRQRLEARAQGLDNLQLHPLQPASRMGGLLALAQLHVLPQIAEAADLVLPSKLSNMLSSGRPVVATAAAGTGVACEIEACGLITPPGDAAALAGAIVALVDDPQLADRMGQNGIVRAHERWSHARILSALEDEFIRLVRPCGPLSQVAANTLAQAEPANK